MSEGGSAVRADVLGGEGWEILGLWIVVGSLHMDSFTSMGANIYPTLEHMPHQRKLTPLLQIFRHNLALIKIIFSGRRANQLQARYCIPCPTAPI